MLRAERASGDCLVLCPHESGWEAGTGRGEGHRGRQGAGGAGSHLALLSRALGCLWAPWKHVSWPDRLERYKALSRLLPGKMERGALSCPTWSTRALEAAA